MPGLITYNGQLLIRGGGLAGSKGCCCTGVVCYCVTRTSNYQTVERWVQCYRLQYYNPVTSSWVFPDGVPCGWGDSPCEPNSVGWFYNAGSGSYGPWPPTSTPPGFPTTCGCGGVAGSGYNLSVIDSPAKATGCSRILPPP